MTLKQGNDVNRQFAIFNDSIRDLNKSLSETENRFQLANYSATKYKYEADSIAFVYNENKKLWNKHRVQYTVISMIFMATMLIFSTF
jgi:predicted RND superfamily exporter protein